MMFLDVQQLMVKLSLVLQTHSTLLAEIGRMLGIVLER